MNFIYFGSARPERLTKELEDLGSYVNYAGNTLQEALIDGFSQHLPRFKIITSWSISPFPRVKRLLFNKKELNDYGNNDCVFVGVLNLPILNRFSKCIRMRRELKMSLHKEEKNVVFVYELHSPFLLAAASLKKRINELCVIVPDLPEYMTDKGNCLRQILKAIDHWLINRCLSRFDSFVLLSEQMRQKLPVDGKRWMLMEGIFKEYPIKHSVEKEALKTIMYTGEVYHRRGTDLLLHAFQLIDYKNYRLWIRGNGEMVDEIKALSEKDPRIRYFEPMPRVELLEMEQRATVMVNPTPPSMDFTNYFFPSKTMEYLASATPTVMFRLGCMPKEYEQFLYYAEEESAIALRDKLVEVCELDVDSREAFGEKARSFILSKKSPYVQCGRILTFVLNQQ